VARVGHESLVVAPSGGQVVLCDGESVLRVGRSLGDELGGGDPLSFMDVATKGVRGRFFSDVWQATGYG
jgi:hypothetical protein